MNETQPQTAPATALDWLIEHWLTVLLVVVVVLLLVLLVVLLIRIRRAAREAAEEEQQEPADEEEAPSSFAKTDPEVSGLKEAFEERLNQLKAYVPGAKYRLQLPWYLLIGEEGQGKTTVLESVALPLPMEPPSQAHRHGVNWWFFQDAVVLDVPGNYLLARDPDATRDLLWDALLRLLQRHRRQRPIDGIILTLPCTDLFESAFGSANKALPPAVIEYKAERIYEKLLDAQRVLGLRVPVYVLITKCDGIPGFQGYVHELPDPFLDTILGWSNPYALEAAFNAEWVNEAFDTLGETLTRSQLELMANGLKTDQPDGFFLFSTEFQTLRDPVSHYLNRIFRPSAYHDPFYLRGIYFTGDGAVERTPARALVSNGANAASVSPAAPPVQETPASLHRPWPVFLRHLFSQKIFPEFELARPISQLFRWRHRTARRLQWASLLVFLVWGLGLFFAYPRLDHNINGNGSAGVLGVLKNIEEDVDTLRYYQHGGAVEHLSPVEDLLIKETKHLIQGFADLDAGGLWSVFIPASWFSPINREVRDAFTFAYDEVVFKLFHWELGHEADRVIGASYRAPPRRRASLLSLEEQPRFQELRGFVREVTALETQAVRYNRFDDKREKDLEHLAGIVEYLFRRQHYEVPSGFYDDAGLYQAALGGIRIDSFRFDLYQPRVNVKADSLVAGLYVDLYAKNVLFNRLLELQQHLETVREIDQQGYQPVEEAELLFQTLPLIREVEFWLDDPKLAYLQYKTAPDADTLSLTQLVGTAFEDLVGHMEGSSFFTPGRGYEALAWRALERAQEQMLALEIPPTTQRMLVPGQERALELSPDMREVKKAMVKLLERHISDPKAPRRIPVPYKYGGRYRFRDRYRLVWNPNLLEEATALPKAYDDLTDSSEKALVAVLMTDLVARAAVLQPNQAAADLHVSEEEVRPQIDNFVLASPHIVQALDWFQALGARWQQQALARLTSEQALGLLQQVDDLLQDGHPYAFSLNQVYRWRPGEPLYTAVFDTDDENAVEDYLSRQRKRVQYLASDFAAPLLAFLEDRHAEYAPKPSDLVVRWRKVGQVLAAYEQAQPQNSLGALEAFVGRVMQTTTPDLCLKALAAPQPRGQDLFLDRLGQLRASLQTICTAVNLDDTIVEYEALAEDFNATLARRFPFDARATGPEMDPQALRRFFKQYDPFAGTYQPFIESNPDDFDPSITPFLDALAKTRAFFAPFLDDEKEDALPRYDFDVVFRVDRNREHSGSNIIDWQLVVEDRVIDLRDTVRTGNWAYGEPVRLVLRWAKDGPLEPVATGTPNARTDVEARRVTFEYRNAWALLSLMDRHRASRPGQAPGTLEFAIPTRPVGAPSPAATDTSVVYVRLTLRPPGSNVALVVPDLFPGRAPENAMPEAN